MHASYFKYLSVDGAIAVLSNQSLRWAAPSTFNDPADVQIDFEVRTNETAIVSRATELIWRRCLGGGQPTANKIGKIIDANAPEFRALGEEKTKAAWREGIKASLAELPELVRRFSDEVLPQLARLKIICFSEINDNILMWSHYGQNHTGIVLEFRNVDSLDSVYKLARPVTYSALPPQFSDDEGLAQVLAGEASIDAQVVDQIIYTKAIDWSYERELRISSGDGREPNQVVEYAGFFTEELVGVYFGCKSSQATRSLVVPLLKSRFPDARLWLGRRETSSYELKFEPFPL